jgi:hypothetical protein
VSPSGWDCSKRLFGFRATKEGAVATSVRSAPLWLLVRPLMLDAGSRIPCEAVSHARQHKQAIQNWKPSDLPRWLTRDVYVKEVQPALASVPKSRIRSTLEVSEPYASNIPSGKRIQHQRHWQALVQLVGVSARGSSRRIFPCPQSGQNRATAGSSARTRRL